MNKDRLGIISLALLVTTLNACSAHNRIDKLEEQIDRLEDQIQVIEVSVGDINNE